MLYGMYVIPLRLKERYAKQIGNGEESRRGKTYEIGTENSSQFMPSSILAARQMPSKLTSTLALGYFRLIYLR
jgi:hypothetical protein